MTTTTKAPETAVATAVPAQALDSTPPATESSAPAAPASAPAAKPAQTRRAPARATAKPPAPEKASPAAKPARARRAPAASPRPENAPAAAPAKVEGRPLKAEARVEQAEAKAEKTGGKAEKAKAKEAKAAKPRKAKMVRDSFTMPEAEYAVIAQLKKRLLGQGLESKKSEVLRAGVALLATLDDVGLAAVLRKVAVIKTGRPAKSGK